MAAAMAHATAESSNESSSDSSDDEEMQKLKEAAVTAEDLTKSQPSHSLKSPSTSLSSHQKHQLPANLPSKRVSEMNDYEDENVLKTTPELRAFLAKKLTEKLDRDMVFCKPESEAARSSYMNLVDVSFMKQDVFLFADSLHPLRVHDDLTSPPPPPQPHRRRQRKISSSSSNSSEEERLASVAVTSDFIDQECAMLARLQSAPSSDSPLTKINNTQTAVTDNGTANCDSAFGAAKKKKKHKKRKSSLACDADSQETAETVASTTAADEGVHVQKKKRKKKKTGLSVSDSADDSKELTTKTGLSAQLYKERQKKKQKQRHLEDL